MSITNRLPANTTQDNVPPWIDSAMQEAWEKARKIIESNKKTENFAKYINDPVAFGTEFLGEYYTDDMIRVAESVRDHTVTIVKSATDVGKSFVAARICLWFFSVFADAKVYITAAPPIENLKQIVWGEMMACVRRKPSLVSGCRVRELLILRNPKNFVSGVSIPITGTSHERESKFSGKHAPHLMFVVDEGDAVPDEVYQGIEGCMSGGQTVRLLIMFNPRAEIGPVYQKERLSQANVVHISAFNHPNVKSGYDVIPGAVTRDVTIRRTNMWTVPLAPEEKIGEDCFEVPDFLEGISVMGLDGNPYPPLEGGWRKIIEPAYSYMVLGKYPALGESQLISTDWVNNARARWDAYVAQYGETPPVFIRPTIGLDVAEFGVDSNVSCARYGGFVPRMRTWTGLDIHATAIRAMDIYYETNAKVIMVDAGGVGAGVAPTMVRKSRTDYPADDSKHINAWGINVSEKPSTLIKSELGSFYILRDQLWWAAREWLQNDPGAMLPPDKFLIEELKVPTYSVVSGKIRVTSKDEIKKKLKRSPDRADALCLTFVPQREIRWGTITDF